MKGAIQFLWKLTFIIFLFLLLFSYAMFQGGFVSWFLFYGFLPIFLYHFGLLVYPIKRWEVTRELSRHVVRSGDSVTVTVQIKRSIPFPLCYCICEEVFPNTLKRVDIQREKYQYLNDPAKLNIDRSIKKVFFPWFRQTMELSYRIENIPRGEHQLRAIRIKTGDLFGFVQKENIFHIDDQLIAYPSGYPIHIKKQISSFDQGSMATFKANKKNTNIVSGIREYMPGDRVSWIDWKQTARKNMVMTKEFEREKSTDTLIILDSSYYEGFNILAFEAAIEVSVSIKKAILNQAKQVDFLSVGKETVFFPFHRDQANKDWLQRYLTRIQPTSHNPYPFSVRLKEETAKKAGGRVIWVVTNRLDEPFKEAVTHIKQRSKRINIVFIKAAELISNHERTLIQQLASQGVVMNVVTEKELKNHKLEVDLS